MSKIMIMLILFFTSSYVFAQSYGYKYSPNSGSKYDWNTGNQYNWNRGHQGNTKVRGYNYNTGSSWNATIKKNGDMHGYDKDYNFWKYDNRTGNYYNFGTGKTCYGKGQFRQCY